MWFSQSVLLVNYPPTHRWQGTDSQHCRETCAVCLPFPLPQPQNAQVFTAEDAYMAYHLSMPHAVGISQFLLTSSDIATEINIFIKYHWVEGPATLKKGDCMRKSLENRAA